MTTTSTTTQATTTTTDSAYSDFIKAAVEASNANNLKAQSVYESGPARIILQSRPIIRTSLNEDSLKSEGQLIRPDVSTRTTSVPIYRRPLKPTILEDETKPVNEESESRGNLLRRQLIPEKVDYDPRQHILNLQQSSGDDVVDVYGSSVTTGSPRPLFTTSKPRYSAADSSPNVPRPTIRYSPSYQKVKEIEYVTDTPTTTDYGPHTTPNPVLQIPPNSDSQETLVAIPHPIDGRMIIVPLTQLRERIFENVDENSQYTVVNGRYIKEEVPRNYPTPAPVFLKRYPQSNKFNSLPVQIDDGGFIREIPQYPQHIPAHARVYPTSIPSEVTEEDINLIKPPVSTRDFQKLLEMLIKRQSRLEQISSLIQSRQFQPVQFGEKYRMVLPAISPTVYVQRPPDTHLANVRYIYPQGNRNVISAQSTGESESRQLYNQKQYFTPTPESFTPTRRVSRLLHSQHEDRENYLPPDVRESLLLKMLQLAINPALPLEIADNAEEATTTVAYGKKAGVRNVEILGEEEDAKGDEGR